jgi:hypothetical protein
MYSTYNMSFEARSDIASLCLVRLLFIVLIYFLRLMHKKCHITVFIFSSEFKYSRTNKRGCLRHFSYCSDCEVVASYFVKILNCYEINEWDGHGNSQCAPVTGAGDTARYPQTMIWVFVQCVRYFCPILTENEICRQIFVKFHSINCNENPSNGSRVFSWGQAEGQT